MIDWGFSWTCTEWTIILSELVKNVLILCLNSDTLLYTNLGTGTQIEQNSQGLYNFFRLESHSDRTSKLDGEGDTFGTIIRH